MQSERRHATVLFADVSGFTRIGGEVDPEELRDLMNRCFVPLEHAVRRFGGHVDKYEGDCIMATFGASSAIENTARAAVNAAIDMRRCIRALRDEGKVPAAIDLHVGINTGVMIAGEVGGATKRDFTVMGSTVNLAARLKDSSPAGTIWVGRDTHRYTRDLFEWTTLAPLTFKNVAEPIPVFELQSSEERDVRDAGRHVASQLVGRDAELARLRDAVAAVATGRGGIARLVGEAGLGKSRLLAELARCDEMRHVLLLEGRAVALGSTAPYQPFVALFRRWAGVAPSDPEPEAFARLATAIESVLGRDTADVLPFIATVCGMRPPGAHAERLAGMSGDGLEKVIARSVRRLIDALAARQPLVLVFDDLHWADASSLDLLDGLVRATDRPALFVLVHRPDPRLDGLPIFAGSAEQLGVPVTDVTLEVLTSKQSDALMENLLGIADLPIHLRTLIARKSEGNPFYVEEVVRTLIEDRVVEAHGDAFRLTARAASVDIPGSIQEIIMTRVDRLPPATKALAQLASVVGRRFPRAVLAAVATESPAALDDELALLRERQLLQATSGSDDDLVFTHALTQEAIYESVTLKTRRTMHAAVATAIERLFADRLTEVYAMLAYHWSRADDLVKAEDYLFRAGDEAARAAASAEALDFFREASRLYLQIHGDGGDPARKALLEANIGYALLNRGELLECIPHFDTALALLGEPVPTTPGALYRRAATDLPVLLWRVWRARDRPPTGSADAARVASLTIRYNCNRAQTTSDMQRGFFDAIRTLRLLTDTDPAAVDEACGMYGGGAALFAFSGLSFRLARRFLRLAEMLVRDDDARDDFVFRSYRFLVGYFEGTWTDDWALPPEVVDQAIRYGQMWDANTYLGLHCEQAIAQGRFDLAASDCVLLRRMADDYGFEFAHSNLRYMTAYELLERRRLDEALHALDRYRESRREALHDLLALGTRAHIELLRNDPSAATATLDAGHALRIRIGLVPPYYLGPLLTSRLLCDVMALDAIRGDPSAVAVVRAARDSLADAQRMATCLARARPAVTRLEGTLEWLRGRHARAVRAWSESLRIGEALGARPEVARTSLEIGRRLAEPGSPTQRIEGVDAAQYLARARTLFAACGLDDETTIPGAGAGRTGAGVDVTP